MERRADCEEKMPDRYAIEPVIHHGYHEGYRVVRTDKEKPFHMVSAVGPKKECWDWLVRNVDEAIHVAPRWYIEATCDTPKIAEGRS